jgi:predicted small lipoprotein YifL
MSFSRRAVAALLAALTLAACGVKGDPVPPEPEETPAERDGY